MAKKKRKYIEDVPKIRETTDFPFYLGALTPISNSQPLPKLNFYRLRSLARSPIPRRAINAIKNQIVSLDWQIAPRRGIRDKRRHEADIRRIEDWLNYPNAADSFRTLLEQVLEDVLVLAAGSIEKQVVDGRPWLWPVDGSSIEIFASWNGEGPRYAQWVGNQYINLTNEELIYIRLNPCTSNPFGLAPLEVASQTVEYLVGAQSYAGSTASKAVTKKLIDLGRSVDPNHVKAFRWYWRNEIEGRGITPIIGGSDRVTAVEIAARDDQGLYLEWQKFLILVIAVCFDLPPKKLGLSRDVNRSTAESDDEATDQEAVKPIAELVAEHINREILWPLGYTDLEFRFRYIVSATDKQQLALALRNMMEVDGLTMDELRDEWGTAPMENEEHGKMTLTAYRKALGGVDREPGMPGREMSNQPTPAAQKGGKDDGKQEGQEEV